MSYPPREGSRDTGEGLLISKFPDVCKSPVCPVPYTIVAKQSDDANTCTSVQLTGMRAHNQGSIITCCTGDEPGTGLGVKSGTVKSVCHRKEHSKTVRFEGKWATRHGDEWWMNNKNTIGKLLYPKSLKNYDPTPPLKEYQVAQAESAIKSDASYGGAAQPNAANTSTAAAPQTRGAGGGPATAPAPSAPANANTPATKSNVVRGPERWWKNPAQMQPRATGPSAGARVLGVLGLGGAAINSAEGLGTMARSYTYPHADDVVARRIEDYFLARGPSGFSREGQAYSQYMMDKLGTFYPFNPSPQAAVDRTNATLSYMAGREVDFRTMPPDELEEILDNPWQPKAQRKPKQEPEASTPPNPHVRTDENVSTRGRRRRRRRNCRLRPYRDGCADALPYSTPHHVVPDRAFREPGKGGALYNGGIPHADGMTLCVEGGTPIFSGPNANEHGRIHGLYNPKERALGLLGNPTGTASLGALEDNGVAAAAEVTGCDPVAMKKQLRDYHAQKGLAPETLFRADHTGTLKPDSSLIGTRTGTGAGGL